MQRFQVEIEGVSPLLMHHNNLAGRDVEGGKGKKGKPGDDRTPAYLWKMSLYADEKQVVLPAENLQAALMKAGQGISTGRFKSLKVASTRILFDDFYLPLLVNGKPILLEDINAIDSSKFSEHCDAAKALGFSLFAKPVRIGKASHVRVRPRFDRWSVSGTFATDSEELLVGDRLEQLWNDAGDFAGVGDWRPSAPKPGGYGRFTAKVTRLKK